MRSVPLLFWLVSSSVVAEERISTNQDLERCLQSVKAVQAGYFLKVEKLNFQGKSIYELEMVNPGHGEWEFLCDAKTGRIIEHETAAMAADDPRFKKNAKLSEPEAAKIALKATPGKIKEVEYELESNGGASYEFDILSEKGVETKIEIDAATGNILETAHEDWEIGEEPGKN
jgi:uncharacterized membrane protein YkoI